MDNGLRAVRGWVMRLHPPRRPWGVVSLPQGSTARWVLVAIGFGLLVTALAGTVEPYRETREFRQVSACEQSVGDCFDDEQGSIVGKRTYTTTSSSTDANGITTTTTTRHYEVTWQRADGSRTTREVRSTFYRKAEEGQPATMRLLRGEVVGVEVAGGSQWFLPESGSALGHWLYLAFFSLGVLLWGLLFGWWDGIFMLAFRTFAWMFLSFMPVTTTTNALAYGLDTGGGLIGQVLFGVVATLIAGTMVVSSLFVRP